MCVVVRFERKRAVLVSVGAKCLLLMEISKLTCQNQTVYTCVAYLNGIVVCAACSKCLIKE